MVKFAEVVGFSTLCCLNVWSLGVCVPERETVGVSDRYSTLEATDRRECDLVAAVSGADNRRVDGAPTSRVEVGACDTAVLLWCTVLVLLLLCVRTVPFHCVVDCAISLPCHCVVDCAVLLRCGLCRFTALFRCGLCRFTALWTVPTLLFRCGLCRFTALWTVWVCVCHLDIERHGAFGLASLCTATSNR